MDASLFFTGTPKRLMYPAQTTRSQKGQSEKVCLDVTPKNVNLGLIPIRKRFVCKHMTRRQR